MRGKIYFIIFLLFTNISYAATLQGAVYDLNLNLVPDVIVEIDTIPQQILIATDGTYKLNVPKGTYQISAKSYDGQILISTTKENLTIEQDGEFIVDLILFPVLEELNENLSISVIDFGEPDVSYTWIWALVIVLLALVALFLARSKLKVKLEKKKIANQKSETEQKILSSRNDFLFDNLELDKDLRKMYEHICTQKRTTQKDLRKEFPFSEAKVSLMIAELEHKGLVTKIKKGRGNVIIKK